MPGCRIERYFDMRYSGQSYELTVPEGASFHHAHQKMYGYSDERRPTEVVAIRVRAVDPVKKEMRADRGAKKKPVPLSITGPALLADYGATTWIPAGWECRTDRFGTRILSR